MGAMCGIVGHIACKASQRSREVVLGGLARLEYRGYDSAGIALASPGHLDVRRALGKLINLSEDLDAQPPADAYAGIGHTRWATHGRPTVANAHPHSSPDGRFSLVHNGIIENYKELKEELEAKGVKFVSQTDTEVIVHLFEEILKENGGDTLKAYESAVKRLRGAYATLLITKLEPGKIFFAKNAAPLIVAKDANGGIFFASSDAALIGVADEAAYLDDGAYGVAGTDEIKIFANGKDINLSFSKRAKGKSYSQKEGYKFFMEKESQYKYHYRMRRERGGVL